MGLKQYETDIRGKKDIFWYFLEIALMVFCIAKYCMISFWYVSFILAQSVLAIKFQYNNYCYWFCNFKNQYRYRACLQSRPCLACTDSSLLEEFERLPLYWDPAHLTPLLSCKLFQNQSLEFFRRVWNVTKTSANVHKTR